MKILNKSVAGDEEGEFTYIGGMGETVIDYVIRKEKVREMVKRLEVRDQVDHQPIIVHVKGKKKRKEMKGRESIKRIGKVSEEEIKRFKEETEEVELRRENIDGKLK